MVRRFGCRIDGQLNIEASQEALPKLERVRVQARHGEIHGHRERLV